MKLTSTKLKLLASGLLACVAVSLLMAQTYTTKVYKDSGGDRMVVASGGTVLVQSGGTVTGNSGGTWSVDTLTIPTHLQLTAHDTEPTGVEGRIYWDDSENAMKVYDGSSWVALSAGSGDNTLDNAYDQGGAGAGRAIDVDSGAVTLTVSDTDNNVALVVAQNDATNDPTAMQITSAADAANAIALDIDAQTTGRDIEGTGASWYVSGAGVITAADAQLTTATVSGALTASTNITLANGGLITNDTNNEIEFAENSEELSLAFTSNTVTLATDTAIDTFGFGDVDAITGVGTLAFDAAAASISLAADGAADDLTIQVTGAQNSSLILSSAGTASDAMQLTTSAGGIVITNAGAAGGEDFSVTSSNASIVLSAAEAVADAINIDATAGGIDIDAVDDVAITVTSGTAGEDLLLTQTGGNDSSITLSAAGTGADAIGIQASAGGLDIDAVDDIIITVASTTGADDLRLIQTGAQDASISLEAAGTGTDAIRLQASAGGIDIDAVDDLNIAVASSAGADDLVIAQTGAFDASVLVQAAGTGADAISLQASAGGIDIDAVDDINIAVASSAGGDDLAIVQTGAFDASILLTAAGTGTDAIGLTASAGGITFSTASGDSNFLHDIDADGAITGDGGGAITGMLVDVTNDADGKNITIAECGGAETNAGAIGAGIWNLPEASTAIGMQYTFVTMAAQNFDINPDDADQILGLTDAAGDAVRNSTVGNTLVLLCVDSTNWVVISNYGTWADVN